MLHVCWRATATWCAAIVGLTGCAVASDFDVHQCRTDADCSAIRQSVSICEAQRCIPGCSSNAQCSAADPEQQICPSRGAECVGLKSEGDECFIDFEYDATAMGALRGEDLALIGAFAPKEPYESPIWQTYQLAVRELNAGGGLPGPRGPQPVLLDVCDEAPEQVRAGVEHLLRLGAQAILATLDHGALREALEALRPEAAVALVPEALPVGSESAATWYIPANREATAAYLPLMNQIQEWERTRTDVAVPAGSRQPFRVATLTSEADGDREHAVALSNEFFQSPGPGLASTLNVVLSDSDAAQRSRGIDDVIAFAPHLVLVLASGFFPEPGGAARITALRELEERWIADTPRPYYVLSPRNLEQGVAELSQESTFPARVIGLRTYREAVAPFEPALAFAGAPRETLLRIYDGTYYLAYALAKARWAGTPMTSHSLQTAMDGLVTPGSEVVEVGPGAAALDRGSALLASGAAFQLLPTTELPSTDIRKRAPQLGTRLVCPAAPADVDAATGASAAQASVVYVPETAAFAVSADGPLPSCLQGPLGGTPQ